MPVIAYHIIISNYGFWLPNDPRGSWSTFVRSWELYLAGGRATKTDSRRSVASAAHDYQKRIAGKAALRRQPVVFNGAQAQAIGEGFGKFARKSSTSILACAIMPRHTHLVIDRPPYDAEIAANLLKGAATTKLTRAGLHPFANSPYANGRLPTPWARKQWICFLDSDEYVRCAMQYVERNPEKDGLRRQRWSFVTPYERASLRDRR